MKTRLNLTKIMLMLPALFGSLYSASAYYDPSAQRWLNRDPIEEQGFELLRSGKNLRTDVGNLYAFVQNDPVRLSDAFGLSIADVANMYQAFVTELTEMCVCHLSCPEIGWRQNVTSYMGCTRQTENLESVFDKISFEDQWDITVNYDTSQWPFNHNSVRVKPWNPADPVVDADTWKGCFSVTWPKCSSQKNFNRCFTCKELLNKK